MFIILNGLPTVAYYGINNWFTIPKTSNYTKASSSALRAMEDKSMDKNENILLICTSFETNQSQKGLCARTWTEPYPISKR